MAVIPDLHKVFIIRDDYVLFEANFISNEQEMSKSEVVVDKFMQLKFAGILYWIQSIENS